ncbi:hypothetical protein [Synechocystis salina]|uniref:Uncharacterized protein n=1 Tax=Synechocystis salina LEGE 00031 TaxID=1828736 RepID=A0ABR9VS78_9SYNC|nr:hypothetical protein [Synechocystis salina]MBE9241150.1 hypothetical protein [Synechocystis salina LEGE 00041]MBE9254218.1 hypothetical protein [Synechocystis salina LEGE 00031]
MSELIDDIRSTLEQLGIDAPCDRHLRQSILNHALTEFLEMLATIDLIDLDKLGEQHSCQFQGGYVEGEGYKWTLTVKEFSGDDEGCN